MDWDIFRLLAHLQLVLDAVTAGCMLYMARGRWVYIRRWWIAGIGLLLIALFFVWLAVSAHGVSPVSRAGCVAPIALLEFSAGAAFTTWLIVMFRSTFRTTVNIKHLLVFGLWVLRVVP